MDRRCQDGERKWRHHHARREQNRPGGEEVSASLIYVHSVICAATPPLISWALTWRCRMGLRNNTERRLFPAGKLWLKRESREPKNWTSCSSRPVPKRAAMSNRWFLQFRHSLERFQVSLLLAPLPVSTVPPRWWSRQHGWIHYEYCAV